MSYELELYQLKNMFKVMAELGAASYIQQTAPAKDRISRREAHRRFGKTRVNAWEADGRISSMRNGTGTNSKLLYSLSELMLCESSEVLAKHLSGNRPSNQTQTSL